MTPFPGSVVLDSGPGKSTLTFLGEAPTPQKHVIKRNSRRGEVPGAHQAFARFMRRNMATSSPVSGVLSFFLGSASASSVKEYIGSKNQDHRTTRTLDEPQRDRSVAIRRDKELCPVLSLRSPAKPNGKVQHPKKKAKQRSLLRKKNPRVVS